MNQAADMALKQIVDKQYAADLTEQSISNILAIAISFSEKKVLVKEQNLLNAERD